MYVLIMCKSKKRDENIQKPEENGKRYTAQGSLGIKYGQEDFFFLFFSLSLQVFFFFSLSGYVNNIYSLLKIWKIEKC